MFIFTLPNGYTYVVQTGMPTDPVMVGTGNSLIDALTSMDTDLAGRQSAAVRSVADAAEIAAYNDGADADEVWAGYTTEYDDVAERLANALNTRIAENDFVDVVEAVEDAWPSDEHDARVDTEHWQTDDGIPHITVSAAYPKDALTDDEWQAWAEDDAWAAPDGWEIVDSGADGGSLVYWHDGIVNTTYVVYAPVLS